MGKKLLMESNKKIILVSFATNDLKEALKDLKLKL